MAKKYSEVEELQEMLDRRRHEMEKLEATNLQVNTQRVHTWHALSAERERLIAQIHQIDTWVTILGMNGPAEEQPKQN